ncbi:DUF2059 domain-containing protein [Poseidonocella sedimentorum]|uniref:Uncharacterized protein n=1 Tax=Poseidonocella sedimentorum TaxID=871652 RepID=A0A1I6EIF2_9RHOB|nr:DUF2059 domain-containing protein [Poseidonocella sedimentorum]SFR17534.1 hypothetical protein SAMN04515673_11286 [Poseidonocella sedimentorum]
MGRILSGIIGVAWMLAPMVGAAADAEEFEDFWRVLRMDDTIEIMREEGLAHSADLGAEMLPGGADGAWALTVETLYGMEVLRGHTRSAMYAAVAEDDLGPLVDWFGTELGQRIVGLEISARTAQLDEDVETAAEQVFLERSAAGDPRVDQIARFIAAGDLVEANLAGSLNANFRFYQGLIEGGGDAVRLSEQQALATVQAQAEEIRADTLMWLNAFLYMSYQPLSDAEMEAYLEFMESPDGALLTRALFAGFDAMFAETSYALGLALGRQMGAVDL